MAAPLPAKNSAPRWWDFLAQKKGLVAVALLFLATIPMLTKKFTSAFGTFYFLHRSCLLRGANPALAVIAIFAFSGFLRIRIQPRPEMFTYLFISLTIFLFSEFYFGKRKRMIYSLR